MLAAPAVGGLVLGALSRLSASALAARLVLPCVFLLAYVATYQKIPDFPPIRSTDKIFYVSLFGSAFGLVLDLARRRRTAGSSASVLFGAVSLIWSFAIALWIGAPRLVDAGAWLALIGLGLGGALVLSRLYAVGKSRVEPGGEMIATAMLAALALGFAPIALFGASSTSFGLCLGVAAGCAIVALLALVRPRPFGASAAFGAGGGLLAVIDTVALITQQIDYAALFVLLGVLFAGQIGARVLLPSDRFDPRLRQLIVSLIAAAPIVVILAILLLRHPNPLGT